MNQDGEGLICLHLSLLATFDLEPFVIRKNNRDAKTGKLIDLPKKLKGRYKHFESWDLDDK